MEPRWREDWKKDRDFTYLGGTNDFDLWFDEDKYIRVVWGEPALQWDYFFWSLSDETYEWGSHDQEYVDHNQVLDESLTYIRIFAPWVEEELKNKERRNDKDNG
jgi:hypothetical protein